MSSGLIRRYVDEAPHQSKGLTIDAARETTVGSRPICAVVVAFGQPGQVAQCLASIDGVVEVVVVDNSQRADVRDVARAQGAHYVDSGGNIGFAAAVNLALDRIESDCDVVLVNPDAVLTPGLIAHLHAALSEKNRVAAAAPLLKGTDGAPQRASWPVPTPRGVWLDSLGLARLRRDPHFLVGAVLMLNRDALLELGWFDERFFLYAEETDWQLRAIRAGWRLTVVDAVTATHVGGGTSVDPWRKEILFHASAAAFGRKWYGRLGWYVMWTGSIVGAALRAAVHRDHRGGEARRLLRIYLHRIPAGAGI